MDVTKAPRKLWEHPNPKSTEMWKFLQETNKKHNLNIQNFNDLWHWSVDNRAAFYDQLFVSQNHIYEGSYTRVVDESIPISKLPKWFYGVRINWAENLLWTRSATDSPQHRSTLNKEDDKVAITEIREGNTEVRDVTWGQLRQMTGELASALWERGVREGDRIVVVGSHSVMTNVVFLATTWLGAIFSSSSTDMGIGGLLQRTVQIDPKFIFFDDGALYNDKILDLREKIAGVVEGMKGCSNFESVIVVKRFVKPNDTSNVPRTERLEAFLNAGKPSPPPIVRVGFQDPMVVFYSSGTTGTPKAIVHGVGPLLMGMKKDGILHRDLKPHDVALQYTTTGWIMYVASVGHSLCGGRVVFYDGSPFLPDLKVLLRVVSEQKVNVFGTSPKWLAEMMKNGIVPKKEVDLSSLKALTSTGMVLPDQIFEWFYDHGFPETVQLGNFSGGTDIAGCFGIENPISPLYVGGCMGGSLGTAVSVYDHDEADGSFGKSVPEGTPGDLVSDAAFPNVPLFLWGDNAPAPGAKYMNAYFGRFKNVWAQGDFCVIHPITKALHLLGRSDGVLNPSGVRFGSADIYAVLEKHFTKEVSESLCVGQRRPQDLDERVVLFLLMKNGVKMDKDLVGRIKDAIARDMTKRHVPKFIFEMPEVPVTVNGKKVELPVKHIISGKTIKPSGTLLNPQSLDFFYQFQKVEELEEPKAKL